MPTMLSCSRHTNLASPDCSCSDFGSAAVESSRATYHIRVDIDNEALFMICKGGRRCFALGVLVSTSCFAGSARLQLQHSLA